MALRRLVAGRALDFEEELCSVCSSPFGICLGAPHGIASVVAGRALVGCWKGPWMLCQTFPELAMQFSARLRHKAGYTIGGGEAPELYSAAISACENGEQ